jgi:hypothetical protein
MEGVMTREKVRGPVADTLVDFVVDQAWDALDRGALLVLSRSGDDLAWSVVPIGSDLDLEDVRFIHTLVGGGGRDPTDAEGG